MQIDKGYVSPYMITDKDRMEASLDDAFILVTDRKISAIKDLLPILEKVLASQFRRGPPPSNHRVQNQVAGIVCESRRNTSPYPFGSNAFLSLHAGMQPS
jgi:hypothetical protein